MTCVWWQAERLPKCGECLAGGAIRYHCPWFFPQLTWIPNEIQLALWLHTFLELLVAHKYETNCRMFCLECCVSLQLDFLQLRCLQRNRWLVASCPKKEWSFQSLLLCKLLEQSALVSVHGSEDELPMANNWAFRPGLFGSTTQANPRFLSLRGKGCVSQLAHFDWKVQAFWWCHCILYMNMIYVRHQWIEGPTSLV